MQKNRKWLMRFPIFLCLILVGLIGIFPSQKASAQVTTQAGIRAFPKSYQKALVELKKAHPTWYFVAVDTGLSMSEVVEAEKGRNTIQSFLGAGGSSQISGAPFSYLSTEPGDYNWETDTYTVCDGSNWFRPNLQVLKYSLDPRNFLDDHNIFMFLGYDLQSKPNLEAVEKILSGSFMDDNLTYQISLKEYNQMKKNKGDDTKTEANEKQAKKRYVTITERYAKVFIDAGIEFGMSPYFLASRSLQEIGYSKSVAVTGTVKGYESLYNYYNVGANDTPANIGSAAVKGLYYARGGANKETTYLRPWNTPKQAIRGGACFMAENYLNTGQNTIYFQKFSVANSKYLYWHQYMSNIQTPLSEGAKLYNTYANNDLMGEKMVFYIPVYEGLSKTPTSLPAIEGNPNGYLKELTITDAKGNNLAKYLNHSFHYRRTEYKLTLPAKVDKLTVSATPISRFARVIKGAKGYAKMEKQAEQDIVVVCRAGNGKDVEYTIHVSWEKK